ncbi:MAG: cytochrome c5 family protein [Gammaproteobacteria bacterium]|nr:cytochrome c5 family protein [Gammaproteobacteria bacterium]
MDQDRKFLDTFLIVIGALLIFTVAMYFLANYLADTYLDTDNSENPLAVAAASERIEPVGSVRTTNDPAPAPSSQAAPVKTAATQEKSLSGEQVYNQACTACHGAGIAGAPKTGDTAAWADRIAQGEDVLLEHAIQGYQGEAGYMPPKGGRTDLSDEEVKAAIDYMVAQSQ